MTYPQQPQPMNQPPKKRKKWPWVVGGMAAFVLVLSAAVSGGGSNPTPATEAAAESPVAVTPAEMTTETNEPIRLGFGESHAWRGGEEITVSVPQEHTESNQFLAAPEGKRYVAFDVTIRNNGEDEYQVMQTKLTVQHNGRVAQQSYTAGDILPDVQLPPGGATTFTSVFEIGEEPGELQVSVQPNFFAADTVYFTGQF